MELINIFQKQNASMTIGIIRNYFGKDIPLTKFIKQRIKNNINNNATLEIANHGWDHEDFTKVSKQEQS